MNSQHARGDYLWDPAETPQANDREADDVQRLEASLSRFRQTESPLSEQTVNEIAEAFAIRRWTDVVQFSFLRMRSALAFAAVAAVVIAGVYFASSVPAPAGSAWNVSRVSGSPLLGASPIADRTQLHPGQVLSTDASSEARIEVDDLGEISVAQGTRVSLLAAGSATGTLGLDHGTIHALIWAPPRRFTVRTPAADAIDLGCSYTLHVSPQGDGWLRVSTGWVAFTDPHAAGRESFIPVGAMCLLKPQTQRSASAPASPNAQANDTIASSIGTPFFEDASATFREALEQFDFSIAQSATPANSRQAQSSLHVLLAEARPRDALTLWHLLARTNGADRALVFDRLAELVPPPSGVSREILLSEGPALADQRRQMRDLWWNALGLRDTDWWRYWERSSPPR
ncbi:MAG TPA: hypothetical protein VFO34_03680 [Candidatus Acidoferrales bacterium]|nr:hypothetical protein [Candidatus Acidoferrales bacterium]